MLLSSIPPERLELGKPGEIATLQYLDSNSAVLRVIDVRDIQLWWPKEIDFIVIYANKERTVEAKTITNNNINLPIQLYEIDFTHKNICREGWFYTSEADVLTVYDAAAYILHIIDFKLFRKWFEKNKKNRKLKTFERDNVVNVYALISVNDLATLANRSEKIKICPDYVPIKTTKEK